MLNRFVLSFVHSFQSSAPVRVKKLLVLFGYHFLVSYRQAPSRNLHCANVLCRVTGVVVVFRSYMSFRWISWTQLASGLNVLLVFSSFPLSLASVFLIHVVNISLCSRPCAPCCSQRRNNRLTHGPSFSCKFCSDHRLLCIRNQ